MTQTSLNLSVCILLCWTDCIRSILRDVGRRRLKVTRFVEFRKVSWLRWRCSRHIFRFFFLHIHYFTYYWSVCRIHMQFFWVWVAKDVVTSLWDRLDAPFSVTISASSVGKLNLILALWHELLHLYSFNWSIPPSELRNIFIVEVCQSANAILVLGDLTNVAPISVFIVSRRQIVLRKQSSDIKFFSQNSCHKGCEILTVVLYFGLCGSYALSDTPAGDFINEFIVTAADCNMCASITNFVLRERV